MRLNLRAVIPCCEVDLDYSISADSILSNPSLVDFHHSWLSSRSRKLPPLLVLEDSLLCLQLKASGLHPETIKFCLPLAFITFRSSEMLRIPQCLDNRLTVNYEILATCSSTYSPVHTSQEAHSDSIK
jgi:hypothetical protein